MATSKIAEPNHCVAVNIGPVIIQSFSGGWIEDPFGIPLPSNERAILNLYNQNSTQFGFLMKRRSDGKINMTLNNSSACSYYVSGAVYV